MVDSQIPSVYPVFRRATPPWSNTSRGSFGPPLSTAGNHFQILMSFYGSVLQEGNGLPSEVVALQLAVKKGRPLRQAFFDLKINQQVKLRNQIGEANLNRIFYLDALNDPKLTAHYQLQIAQQLIHEERFAPAVGILKILTESSQAPASVKKAAQLELEAVQGQGDVGRRFEFLATQLPREALDYKLILPMMIGTGAYYWSRGFFLDKLNGLSKASVLTRGYGAEFLAGVGALGVEVPAFAFSSRGLRYLAGEPLGPWKQELLGAGITLSLLKFSALLGRKGLNHLHGVDPAGVPTQLLTFTRFNQAVIPQVSIFTGLLAAHRLETLWGLRSPVDGATVMTDTFSSLLSLGIGSRLGFATYRSLTGSWRILPPSPRSNSWPTAKPNKFFLDGEFTSAKLSVAGGEIPGSSKLPALELNLLSEGDSNRGSGRGGDYKLRFKDIEVLKLSKDTTKTLRRLGLDRIYMLTWFDEAELAHFFFRRDPKSIAEIRDALKQRGFELGSVLEPPQNKFHYLHLGALGLSFRNQKVLQTRLNIRWIEELIKFTAVDLRRVTNLPPTSIQEIREALQEKGLALNGEEPNQIHLPPPQPEKIPATPKEGATPKQAQAEPEKTLLKPQYDIARLPISKEGRKKLEDRGEIKNIRRLLKESEWNLKWVLGLSENDLTALKKALSENNMTLAPKKIPAKLYRWRIWETALSPKTEVALGKLEIYRVADLLKKSREELEKSPHLLEIHLNEIFEFLEASDLKLRGE